jgi:hypothetical protein
MNVKGCKMEGVYNMNTSMKSAVCSYFYRGGALRWKAWMMSIVGALLVSMEGLNQ